MGRDASIRVAMLRQWLASPDRPRRLVITCRTEDYDEWDLGVDRVAI
jgi:hypothetical protein